MDAGEIGTDSGRQSLPVDAIGRKLLPTPYYIFPHLKQVYIAASNMETCERKVLHNAAS